MIKIHLQSQMLITEKVKEENRATKWIEANGIDVYELSECVMHALGKHIITSYTRISTVSRMR